MHFDRRISNAQFTGNLFIQFAGDDMFEHGGFVVHFFDQALVDELADGFDLIDVAGFSEGALPRRLWRVTMRAA